MIKAKDNTYRAGFLGKLKNFRSVCPWVDLDPQAKHFLERAMCCMKQCTNHNTIQLCKKEHIVPKCTRKLATHDIKSKSKLTCLPNYPGSQGLSMFYVLSLQLTAKLIQFTDIKYTASS
jgi:hypothetical protein